MFRDFGSGNSGTVAVVGGKPFWSVNDYERLRVGFTQFDSIYDAGTTVPEMKLDVNGSARAGQVVFARGFASAGKGGYIFSGAGGPGDVDAELGFKVSNSGSTGNTGDGPLVAARGNAFSRIPNQRGGVFIMAGSGIASPSAGEGEVQLWTNATQRMAVTYAGNVGIGTAAPSSKLHVAGDIRVDGNINAKYQDVAE